MAFQSTTLDVKTSVAVGDASVAKMKDMAVQITGTFSATLDVEASADGTNFEDVPSGGGITAPAIVAIPYMAHSVRINTTAYTSGTPVAVLVGDNNRLD